MQKIIKSVFFQNSAVDLGIVPGGIFKVLLQSGCRCQFYHPVTTLQTARSSSTSPETKAEYEENTTKRKVLKVAILGRPNAGKSTLINRILNKSVCDVSSKTHTTRMLLKTALTVHDTQIVFVDTPGVVTKQEFKRFELSDSFLEWKKKLFSEVDIVGVIYEAPRIHETRNFHMKFMNCLNELPETTPSFLVITKIDLVADKEKLIKASKRLLEIKKSERISESSDLEDTTEKSEENLKPKKMNLKERFSKVFYISALKNEGVGDVVTYLLDQAKEGEWVLSTDQPFDAPLHKVILNLTRAELLNLLPHLMPYTLEFQIELLEENDLGQIICVVLVKCPKTSSKAYILSKRFNKIKTIARKLETDLYNIFQKQFQLTIVIADKTGHA